MLLKLHIVNEDGADLGVNYLNLDHVMWFRSLTSQEKAGHFYPQLANACIQMVNRGTLLVQENVDAILLQINYPDHQSNISLDVIHS